jgi:hypothetical protein
MWLCALVVAGGLALSDLQAQTPAPASADPRTTFDGEIALWTVAINADRTADFEQVVQRLHEGLKKLGTPERQRQAAGWKVVRLSPAMPDGTVAYMHVIHPVVPEADYSVMRVLYDAFPEERQALYELYRGAFARNLSLVTGGIAVDLGAEDLVEPAPSEP